MPKKVVSNNEKNSYTAKDIYVLEGLEPVRKRPGMYIGSTGPSGLHHLIWEVVDNSIDEAMAGFATEIEVRFLKNNMVSVEDNGRGIPIDIHKQTKKSALETVMTTLHAGGKFGGESYKVSGGLHGVGVSVVNALSSWLKAEVCRDGFLYEQEYERGKPKAQVKKVGKCNQGGTKITFIPDEMIFSKTEFDRKQILDHFREQAYLTKGLRIALIDEREGSPFYHAFRFDGGLLSFIDYLNEDGHEVVHDNVFHVHKDYEDMDVEVALSYNDGVETVELSFANNINTTDGGMHVTGFRSALTRTINDYAKANNVFKKGDENVTGDDVREGMVAIVSVKIGGEGRAPQFEGQTKARLGNPEARSAVEAVVGLALKEFLEKRPSDARAIIAKTMLAARARLAAKAAKETVLRKGALDGLTLPGKLADCQKGTSVEEAELFIVEGDSAGGCFSGDTEVALVDGRNLSFKELVEEYKQGKESFCYTIREDGDVGIAPILQPRLTKKNQKVIKVVLDSGQEITCTPDHKFMLRSGSFKEAQALKNEDSLMPLYRQYSKLGKRITIKGYEMIFDSQEQRWIFTHLLADKYNLERRVYSGEDGSHRHHKDFNKLNNNPDNVTRLSKEEHLKVHQEAAYKTLNRPEVREKLRVLRRTPEFRQKISRAMSSPRMRKMLSERAKKQWKDPAYKTFMIEKFLAFYRNNGNYRTYSQAVLQAAQKEYWGKEENRKKQTEQVKKYFEQHPEKKTELSLLAKEQWQDQDLLTWRRDETSKQWTPEFREKRRKTYNSTYYQKAMAVLRRIYEENGKADLEEYEQIRKETNDKNLLRSDTLLTRFFENNEAKLRSAVEHYNHKIKAIVHLNKKIDVYDLEVPETHNFALAFGVFVHNSAKQARDRRTQAILPLRGKILNSERARIDKVLANKEMASLVIALGTAIADEFDLSKIRYHKVIIMTDADVDGSHIRTLLLTLFFRYFPQIIESGYLYVALPPLYRIAKGKAVSYAYSDAERDKVLGELKGSAGVSIQRYKGLGEMNPDQLWETTMNPGNRSLRVVAVQDAREADKLFELLMGDEVGPRKHFIQVHATSVKNLDI